MIRLLRALFADPEAERDAGAWATRFMAHVGVGSLLWMAFVSVAGPGWASGILGAVYIAWEVGQLILIRDKLRMRDGGDDNPR